MENTNSSICSQIDRNEKRNESIKWKVMNLSSSTPTEVVRELSQTSDITSTITTVLDTKVSVFMETGKSDSPIHLDSNLNKTEPEKESEFVEEKGGYEDDDEVSELDGDYEDGFVEKDEEGGYEDEDEENEEC